MIMRKLRFFSSGSQRVFDFNLQSMMTEAQRLFMVEFVSDSESVIVQDSS